MEQSTVISASALGKSVIGPEWEIRILDAVEMTVNAGASIAIVGASGSGKTTLLGLLAGLDLPSRGDIHIAGEHLNALGEARSEERRVGKECVRTGTSRCAPTH